ncbi:hypothetical protein BT63DRAFT_420639, partial [Microthyrium microscopicum]
MAGSSEAGPSRPDSFGAFMAKTFQRNQRPDSFNTFTSTGFPEARRGSGTTFFSSKPGSRSGRSFSLLRPESSNTLIPRHHRPPVGSSLRPESDATLISSPNISSNKYDQLPPGAVPASYEKAAKALARTRPVLDVVFRELNVYGTAAPSHVQETVTSILQIPFQKIFGAKKPAPKRLILQNLHGFVKSGELMAVIGRPGSGCSTFLKTIAGELNGLVVDAESILSYGGIPQERFKRFFDGESNYNPELDIHFPHLTVQQTLEFASALRAPHDQLLRQSRAEYAKDVTERVIDTYKLGHVVNSPVGNEFIRGVSGGERKRVSIGEMLVSGCSVGCWDQSTRGLDSVTALEFVRSLRTDAKKKGSVHFASLYQVSDALLMEFTRVVVLYEGRQVYYGSPAGATYYFESMGWLRPRSQPIGDYLAAVTNPLERKPREGYEHRVPRNAEEFEKSWLESRNYRKLQRNLEFYKREEEKQAFLPDSERLLALKNNRAFTNTSSYLASQSTQLRYCIVRMAQRLKNDKKSVLILTWGQTVMSLILGSLFYKTSNDTDGLYSKGGVLFASILLNAVVTITEIFQLFGNKPIVERQSRYAMYHPWTEALAGVILNVPIKLITAFIFNTILYFLSGLHRTAEGYFTFFLFVFIITLVMSSVFRTIGALATILPQAFAMVGVILPLFIVYTGFVIPKPYMHPWFKWLTYINPVGYAFESMITNEFHDRDFNCSSERVVPPYAKQMGGGFACAMRGAVENQAFVSGDAYVQANYEYYYSHIWRNLGILVAFLAFFVGLYLWVSERNVASPVSTDGLIFRKGHEPGAHDPHLSMQSSTVSLTDEKEKKFDLVHTKTLSWSNVCYDIQINKETKRILNDICGWVKPGTLTALMGASGAGKTTLLNALAKQLTTGVVTGDILLEGSQLPAGFERNCGYVQQQELHVETATVREALQFSALLRQSRKIPKAEKLAFVEQIIDVLGMEEFSEAVVGVPGLGLNTRQRKLLSIGVELAAKPSVLLFLDEPTTGLDSQSAYHVVSFLKFLAENGMSILCTIHQPSAALFHQFDRILLLVKGGRTAYFGDIGKDAETVVDYFERNGARKYGAKENPAEYMIEVAAVAEKDWSTVWFSSPEAEKASEELNRIKHDADSRPEDESVNAETNEFAASFPQQMLYVCQRVYRQYWRTPQYIWGKIMLSIVSSLFIGFTFYQSDSSIQGTQNVLFAIFMQAVIYPPLVFQIIPKFAANRELYEIRERASKTYSWQAFLFSQILAEVPYQILMGCIVFCVWNYTVLGVQTAEQQGIVLIFMIQFFVWAGTIAQMVISVVPVPEVAGMISIVMFVLSLLFSGVIQPPSNMPSFWHFLWHVSPLTHWVAGISSAGLHNRLVSCAAAELSHFSPPNGTTCGQYLNQYLNVGHAPGNLLNPNATADCQYCMLSSADQILAQDSIYWSDRWTNFGYGMAYIGFNVLMTVWLYYVVRLGSIKKKVLALKAKRQAKSG